MMEITSSDAVTPKPLIELEASLGLHKRGYGVVLSVKSAAWEELFKKLSGGKVVNWKRDGVEGSIYDLSLGSGEGFTELHPNGKYLLSDDGRGKELVNLFYLRLEGLGKGVEVFFPGVYERDMVRRYAQVAAERSVNLFKKLSPGSVRVKIFLDDWESYKESR